MKLKRKPLKDGSLELWLDWTKRTLDRANQVIAQHGTLASNHATNEHLKWAQHCVRFGLEGKPEHLLKPVLLFRCQKWWRFQKLYNDLNWDPAFHAGRGRPYSWEDRLRTDWALEWSQPSFLAARRQS